MQVVYEAWNLIDAYLARQALDDGGIPVFVRGGALGWGVGKPPAWGLLAVCVPDDCPPQAREMLDSLPLLAGHPGDAGSVRLTGAVPA